MKIKNQKEKIKIIFMGTPEFGAIILKGLINGGYKPVLVISSPDEPVGRKQVITPPPVKLIAEQYEIPILQPIKIRDCKSQIMASKPDLIVIAAYTQIIPKEILEIPKYGCLNVHPSLLPKYRGPAPVQFTILNGDNAAGVTIILVDDKMDHGPIVAYKKVEIQDSKITLLKLKKILAEIGAKLLTETIPKWIDGKIEPRPQNEPQATYTKILEREDGKIDWQKPAEYIEKQIRAYDPWPGSFTMHKEKRIKILKADVLIQTKISPVGPPGKTFLAPNDKIAVQTGKDYLIIEMLQLEGKNPINSRDFLRGHRDFVGAILN